MHRDATTKKGRHYCGIEFSDGDKTYTAGLREVTDGRAETYVDATHEVLADIASTCTNTNSGTDHDYCYSSLLQNVATFMTDRSVTEQKVNNLLNQQKTDKNLPEALSFKCGVHALLQFSEVCQKN